MKVTALALSLAGSALALPSSPSPSSSDSSSSSSPSASASASPQTPQPFTVVAARSASPIHYLTLTASKSHFWLGGKSSTLCPENVEKLGGCPAGEETAIVGDSALDVVVPGGQAIYVDASGALSFTVPHSGYIPPGSSTTGFKYSPPASGNKKDLGSWTYTGQGAKGFMACPVAGNNETAQDASRWQVFANQGNATVPGGNVGDCLGLNAMAVARDGSQGGAAWEYI